MNCTRCGAVLQPGNPNCPNCGAPVNQAPVYQQPYQQQPVPRNQMMGNPVQVLVFGIIGLAACGSVIVGLIFSILGLTKANQYIAAYGDVSNQVRIGRRLAIAGLILSIVCLLLLILLIVLIVSNPEAFKEAASSQVSVRFKL